MGENTRSDQFDDEVVARVLSGDKESYRALVDKYGSRVIAFCSSRLGSEEEGRDAAQEVFIRAFSSLPTFRRGESFAAWVFAIAANRVRTRFKLFDTQRRKTEAMKNEAIVAIPQDPAMEAEASLRAEALRRAVSALPADLRRPIEFYYFGGLSVAETARLLGIGEEAVKTRLFRARKSLKITLESEQPPIASRGIH